MRYEIWKGKKNWGQKAGRNSGQCIISGIIYTTETDAELASFFSVGGRS